MRYGKSGALLKSIVIKGLFAVLILTAPLTSMAEECAFLPGQLIELASSREDKTPADEFRSLMRDVVNLTLFIPFDAYPEEKGLQIKSLIHFMQIPNVYYWNDALTSTVNPGTFYSPGVSIEKGLPFNVNVGFAFLKNSTFCLELYDFSASWSIIPGWEDFYSLAVRYDFVYWKSKGFLWAYGSNISAVLSKRLGRFTPYAGIILSFTRAFSTSSLRKHLKSPFVFTGKGAIGIDYSISVIRVGVQISIATLVSYMLSLGADF